MKILTYKLDTTKDLLTSRAGLLAIAQVMESLNLSERINKYFPAPKSNRGFKPSTFVQTLILMQHEGGFHLDDVALQAVLSLNIIPNARTLGGWLVRTGNNQQALWALREVNKAVLQSALHHRFLLLQNRHTTAMDGGSANNAGAVICPYILSITCRSNCRKRQLIEVSLWLFD